MKPHIYKAFNVWFCDSSLSWQGIGLSPVLAYRDWLKVNKN